MAVRDIVVRIAGEGGEGVISCGDILGKAAAHASYEVFTFRTFPAEIKGGLAMVQVRLNLEPIHSIGQNADILMAFSQEAFDVYGKDMTSRGLVVFDPKFVSIPDDYRYPKYPLPLHDIAMDKTQTKLSKNIVALAALTRILGIPTEKAKELVLQRFQRKGQAVVESNIKAFDAGYQAVEERFPDYRLEQAAERDSEVIISGNDAVALGAMAAGCKYVAGYPITPATSILEFLVKYMPAQGGVVLQFEDEMAALASCLGASLSGAKAMTPTSGPGLALMGELMNLASMVELPVVIVDVQRGGPSTGLPTKTEQSDLAYAIHGAAGEAPRAVVAPTTIEDCFYQTINAFNIAEKYQIPVIVLSDQSMAFRTKTVAIPDFDAIEVAYRELAETDGGEEFKRYEITPTGVSPMSLPGMHDGQYIASGLEHDEKGAPNYRPINHERMMAKRYRKLDTLAAELENGNGVYEIPDGAEIGVIGWGSTEGPIKEALDMAKEDGIRFAHLQPKVLWPLPRKMIGSFLRPLKKVLVFEENFTGQFAEILKTNFDVEPIKVTKCHGMPFTSDEIYEELKKHA